MDEEEARKILGADIRSNESLLNLINYVDWKPEDEDVYLDGLFNAKELEAIAWWIGSKRKEK